MIKPTISTILHKNEEALSLFKQAHLTKFKPVLDEIKKLGEDSLEKEVFFQDLSLWVKTAHNKIPSCDISPGITNFKNKTSQIENIPEVESLVSTLDNHLKQSVDVILGLSKATLADEQQLSLQIKAAIKANKDILKEAPEHLQGKLCDNPLAEEAVKTVGNYFASCPDALLIWLQDVDFSIPLTFLLTEHRVLAALGATAFIGSIATLTVPSNFEYFLKGAYEHSQKVLTISKNVTSLSPDDKELISKLEIKPSVGKIPPIFLKENFVNGSSDWKSRACLLGYSTCLTIGIGYCGGFDKFIQPCWAALSKLTFITTPQRPLIFGLNSRVTFFDFLKKFNSPFKK